MNQIIDFDRKGNVVLFYLGTNGDQWGDDFNDRPYEHNAGTVYDEFVSGTKEVYFAYGDVVREPCDGVTNSSYSKEDMIKRKVPCIVVLKAEDAADTYWDDFASVLGHEKAIKYYFGDEA